VSPRWQEADEAVESLVAVLVAEAAHTADRSARKRPGGRARVKRRAKGTRRHIAEVIRAHRLAPGLRVDRNMVAALFIGHRDLVTNPVLVVAVAQACGIITGRKLSAKKAARLRAASSRAGKLIARAEADTLRVPAPRPAPTPAEPGRVEFPRVDVTRVEAEQVEVGPAEAGQVGRAGAEAQQVGRAEAEQAEVGRAEGGTAQSSSAGVAPVAGRPQRTAAGGRRSKKTPGAARQRRRLRRRAHRRRLAAIALFAITVLLLVVALIAVA
jgi:hypothetical protein